MTSQLNVDTIVDKAGSGGTNVKVGDTSTFVQGSVTQNLVQGLVKQRLYYNQVASTIKDSFNVSSVTDGSAGRMAVTLTSAYTSLDEYQAHGYGNAYNGDSWGAYNTTPCKVNWAFTNTTSLYDYTNHVSSGYVDGTYAYCFSLGDLA
jgi:hypothetical protein